jgi:hypothetical protein
MRRALVTVLAVAVLFGGVGPSFADDDEPMLPTHSRVRVRALDGRTLVGTVLASDAEHVTLQFDRVSIQDDPQVLTIHSSDIQRIDLSVGSHRNAGKGFLIGTGIGLVGGLTLGAIAAHGCSGDDPCGLALIVVPMFTAPIGAVVGTLVGVVSKTDVWKPMALADHRVSLNIAPTPGHGWRGGLSVSF